MSDPAPPQHVAVVGGGVIGAACAHFLADRGVRVTVLERDRFGAACSHGNCGLVTPSHVLPPAEPGVFGEAVRGLFRPDSPLRLAPRFDPALWRWMAAFARRCNERDAVAAGGGIRPLLDSSRALYDSLKHDLECEFEAAGLLFVFRTAAAHAAYARTDGLLREHFDAGAECLDGDALHAFEPSLKPGLAGGWFYGSDAHLRPDRLMRSWRASLEDRGVTIREGVAVRGFDERDGTVAAVTTDDGPVAADAVVVAAGAFSPAFAEPLGVRVPVQPGKGYSLTLRRPDVCPRVPMLLPEHRVAVTPWPSGLRLGSIMEFAGYDTRIPPRRLALLTRGASHYLDVPAEVPADAEEQWTGLRPMTPDGLPLIDRSPRLTNAWIAAGHNMLGLSMAPGTGKLVAELVGGVDPHLDPGPYRAGRFA